MISRQNLILGGILIVQICLIGAQRWVGASTSKPVKRGLILKGFDSDGVSELRIESGADDKETVTVVKGDTDSAWRVSEEHEYPADPSKVDQTIRDLAGLEIADVVSTTDHHHVDLKVADNTYEKRVVLKGPKEPIELLFGTSGKSGSVHVRKKGEDTVYAARNFSSWRISSRPENWIERDYFELDKDRIIAISVKNDNGQFTIERRGKDEWTVSPAKGNSFAAGEGKVSTLLDKIARVTINEVAGKLGQKDFDMSSPVAEVVVGLAAPTEAEPEGEDPGEEAKTTSASASQKTEPAAETSRTLKISRKPQDDDHFLVHADGSEFVGELGKWSVKGILEAKAEAFREEEKKDESTDSDAVIP